MRTLLALLAAVPLAASDTEIAISHWGPTTLLITAPVGAQEVNLGHRMHQRLTVDFADTSLSDVADFLRTVTDCNIVIDPQVRIADPRVTLKATDLELGAVLRWVTKLTDTHMGFVSGAIWISKEPYQGESRTRLYDVSDLVTPVRDFPGPDLAIPEPGGAGAKLQPAAQDEPRPAATIEEVEELLRKVVAH